jgi:hypothetical protein|tara:strand:+ start:932 stop:1060 length:129 start_codon:yes stop_codon:yes gene_type:complete
MAIYANGKTRDNITHTCEMCDKTVSQEEYDFCDICGDCLEGE